MRRRQMIVNTKEMSNYSVCHCEERSDEAISTVAYMLKAGDCFATLAMTSKSRFVSRTAYFQTMPE